MENEQVDTYLEPSPSTPLVLVVGALSFLGSHIVYQLLEKGYRVRGTVSPTNPDYHTLVAAMEKAISKLPGELELVPLDVLDILGWKRVFNDVKFVFHLANPRIMDFSQMTIENTLPAVVGTRLMMEAAQNSETVRKVIFTSCCCTLADLFDPSREYSESDWNRESNTKLNTYEYSKTRAELLATHLANLPASSIKLVSIVAGVLLGPPILPRLSASHDALRLFLDGSAPYMPRLQLPIADVRDVAAAHVLAMTTSSIRGRYCLAHSSISTPEIMHIIKTEYVHQSRLPHLPEKTLFDFVVRRVGIHLEPDPCSSYWLNNVGRKVQINCSKARAAGMTLRPLSETILDTAQYLLDHHLLEVPSSPRCVLS